MNTGTKSAGARLQRIKIVSRIVRYAVLGCLALTIGQFLYCFWFLLLSSGTLGYWGQHLLMFPLDVVLCIWYWKLARLFQFYERGLIFATETIRCIKGLGVLCVINWVLTSALTLGHLCGPPPPHVVPPGVTVKVVESSFSMGFFYFSIAGINIGPLLVGFAIVIIAWIMDEGRKIREEQELTV